MIRTLLTHPSQVQLLATFNVRQRKAPQVNLGKSTSQLDHLSYQRCFRQARHMEGVTRSTDQLFLNF